MHGTGTISAPTIVMKASGFAFVVAALLTALSGVVGASHGIAQPPALSMSATLFRDIARRQNPAVVSIMARSRVRAWREDEEEILRFFEPVLPNLGQRVHRVLGSGFIISSTGEILTNNHVVAGAERIEVSLFGDERKRYRAIRIGSDPQTDSALLRLEAPPPNLQMAAFGDSNALEPGDWVMAIGNPFQLGHTATVGVVSFPQRPVQVQNGRWQDLIQTDARINLGNSGGPLFNVRGEVVGMNVAMVDADTGGSTGIGFAIPSNTVKALLPQLRKGKVVRGDLGVEFHRGPIREDEATALRLPSAAGAIVKIVGDGSAAERAGLRAGDVVVEIDGTAVADTRDLVARTAAAAPRTRAIVKVFRDGNEQVRTVTIEEQPVEAVDEAPADNADGDDGLTLGEVTPPRLSHRPVASPGRGALVVEVAPHSPADAAELVAGDIVQAINGRAVQTLAEARRELHLIEPDRPIFLLVSRRGTKVFLQMRKD